MGKDSKQFTLMFPIALADALERCCGAGKQDFIRAAAAEKLARDFGENISPILARAAQGERKDLSCPAARAAALPALRKQAAAARDALAKIRAAEKTLAPYGGAAKVIETGEGAEACENALDSLTSAQRDLIDSFPRSRKLRERAEKAFAGARARLSALADARRERDAADAEFESALERGESADYRRAEAVRKRVERLSAQRETFLEKFLTLRAEALRVARDCAERAAGVPAPKPRRGRGDKAAGK